MREIKFRAWDKSIKAMSEPFTIWDKTIIINGKPQALSKDNCEIMRFTGQKDDNGVDIYEGDLVRMIDMHPRNINEDYFIGRIGISEYGVYCYCDELDRDIDEGGWLPDSEVVGNIYEHSHLIGKKK